MASTKRRVVVTGLGLLTPLGLGVKENWINLLAGKSTIVSLETDRNIIFKKIKIYFKIQIRNINKLKSYL